MNTRKICFFLFDIKNFLTGLRQCIENVNQEVSSIHVIFYLWGTCKSVVLQMYMEIFPIFYDKKNKRDGDRCVVSQDNFNHSEQRQ